MIKARTLGAILTSIADLGKEVVVQDKVKSKGINPLFISALIK